MIAEPDSESRYGPTSLVVSEAQSASDHTLEQVGVDLDQSTPVMA
jgi:hypothetical protein